MWFPLIYFKKLFEKFCINFSYIDLKRDIQFVSIEKLKILLGIYEKCWKWILTWRESLKKKFWSCKYIYLIPACPDASFNIIKSENRRCKARISRWPFGYFRYKLTTMIIFVLNDMVSILKIVAQPIWSTNFPTKIFFYIYIYIK